MNTLTKVALFFLVGKLLTTCGTAAYNLLKQPTQLTPADQVQLLSSLNEVERRQVCINQGVQLQDCNRTFEHIIQQLKKETKD